MHLTTTFHPHRVPFQDAPIYVCVKDSAENHNQSKMLQTFSKKKKARCFKQAATILNLKEIGQTTYLIKCKNMNVWGWEAWERDGSGSPRKIARRCFHLDRL